jgi:hypothetical protein
MILKDVQYFKRRKLFIISGFVDSWFMSRFLSGSLRFYDFCG